MDLLFELSPSESALEFSSKAAHPLQVPCLSFLLCMSSAQQARLPLQALPTLDSYLEAVCSLSLSMPRHLDRRFQEATLPRPHTRWFSGKSNLQLPLLLEAPRDASRHSNVHQVESRDQRTDWVGKNQSIGPHDRHLLIGTAPPLTLRRVSFQLSAEAPC